MSVYAGTNFKSSGLVFCYDELNPRTLTTKDAAYNRTASTQSGTTRGFTWDSILATTAAQVAQYNSSATGTGFSGCLWVRRTGGTTGSYDHWVTIDAGGPRYRHLWLGWTYNSLDQVHCSMPYYDGTNSSQWWSVDPSWSSVGLSLQINTWYFFGFSYTNQSRILSTYINGILAASGTRPGLGDINNAAGAGIYITGCDLISSSNSQTRFFAIYNTPLTDQEMYNNYLATKSRYS